MVLVLKNDQMENLLPMSEEIDAIEQAFRELGEGKAMNAPRARLRTPWKEEGGQYYFNNIMGLVPGDQVHGAAHRFELFQRRPGRRQQAPRLSRRLYRSGHALRHGHLRDLGADGRSLHLDHARRRHQRRRQQISRAQRCQDHGTLGSGEQARTQVTAHACRAAAEEGQSLQSDQRESREIRQRDEPGNRRRSRAGRICRGSGARQRYRQRRDQHGRSGDSRQVGSKPACM